MTMPQYHSDPAWELMAPEKVSMQRNAVSFFPERMDWETFIAQWGSEWEQGDHVTIIGPTKSGKSTLLRSLLELRDWVIILCSKKKDATYDRYLTEFKYKRFSKWPPPTPPRKQNTQHLLQWPKIVTMDDLRKLGPTFKTTLEQIFVDGGWTLALDDLYYLAKVFKLSQPISDINYQVRSLGVTQISAMQRPAWVPISCWDQVTHAFISQLANVDDISAIRGLARVSGRELQSWTNALELHEWLYLPVHGGHADPLIVMPPA